MEGKRKKPTKKAASAKAAKKRFYRNKLYQNPIKLSSLKILIGEILLFGNRNQKGYWPLLDVMLRQFICLRISQDSHQGHSVQSESNISGQRIDC